MALLELDGVRAGYGQTRVLHGVSLSVGEGDVVALLGANGAGKTTTLRAITGGVRWDGIINFGGRSLRRATTESIVRMGIAHVPEGRGVLTELTVEENLRAAATVSPRTTTGSSATSPSCASGASSPPARCPVASSRCSRSRALFS